MHTATTDVLIVGAGPTGLTLAAALAVRGIRATVVDREARGANTSRAAVVHARTLEVLETIGVADRLVSLGIRAQRFTIRDRDRVLVPVRFDDLPTRYPYTLMISQAVTEAVLLERFTELGGQVLWGRGVTDVAQDDECVTATLGDGMRLSARYLVGADGMNSTIRDRAGIGFHGDSYDESFALADVRMTGAVPGDEVILYFSPAGMVVVAPLPDGVHRIVAVVDSAPEHPDVDYVQALLDARGPEHERAIVKEVVWGSRFRVHHRVADTYRSGRILLAGDAAHVHSPAGGQGMNTGIQDAMALAEALATTLISGNEEPLNAYSSIRRPIARQVMALADGLTRLATVGRRLRPIRNMLLRLLAYVPAFRRRLAWRLSGLMYASHSTARSE
jgi:2-polyprenyl-6-methoxyphenol hydroxylase-like FAD-dependent oxidoreductase